MTLRRFGRWTRPRDLCVMRHWRREQDGSFVILYQSTTHLKCPRKSGVVRAHLHGPHNTLVESAISGSTRQR